MRKFLPVKYNTISNFLTLLQCIATHDFLISYFCSYILSLAVADLLVIVTTVGITRIFFLLKFILMWNITFQVPFTTTIFIYPSWLWGDLICRTSEFFKDLSIGVSVFTLTALSGDRFFAIVNPLRKLHSYHGKRARRITIAIITSIWTLATLMGIPAIKASHVITKTHMERGVNITFKICYPFPEEWGKSYAQTIVMGRFLFHYAIPLAIISVFYVLIAKHLMHSANHVPGELQGTERQVRYEVRWTFMTKLNILLWFKTGEDTSQSCGDCAFVRCPVWDLLFSHSSVYAVVLLQVIKFERFWSCYNKKNVWCLIFWMFFIQITHYVYFSSVLIQRTTTTLSGMCYGER